MSKLKELRLSAGMSRAQLSEASGVNARQIQRIENGEGDMSNVTLANAIKLADALGVDVRDLIDSKKDARTRAKGE